MNGTKLYTDAADVPDFIGGVVEERSIRVEVEGEPTMDCIEVIMRT